MRDQGLGKREEGPGTREEGRGKRDQGLGKRNSVADIPQLAPLGATSLVTQ